ncbi:MAG TPA: hypothetical protein VMX17_16785 [Candidatus Glassbacteria bacterium]|nr:hypothetical protein [Candidatus Glassbacteria bacterium]
MIAKKVVSWWVKTKENARVKIVTVFPIPFRSNERYIKRRDSNPKLRIVVYPPH